MIDSGFNPNQEELAIVLPLIIKVNVERQGWIGERNGVPNYSMNQFEITNQEQIMETIERQVKKELFK